VWPPSLSGARAFKPFEPLYWRLRTSSLIRRRPALHPHKHRPRPKHLARSERATRSFSRSFTLPANADPGNISANLDKGVLKARQPLAPRARARCGACERERPLGPRPAAHPPHAHDLPQKQISNLRRSASPRRRRRGTSPSASPSAAAASSSRRSRPAWAPARSESADGGNCRGGGGLLRRQRRASGRPRFWACPARGPLAGGGGRRAPPPIPHHPSSCVCLE